MATRYSPNITTNGLVLCLDAANPKSYVSGSTTWNDLSGNKNTGTLTNGPTYSSASAGFIVFDGVDDTIITTNSGISGTSPWSLSVWVNVNISENGAGRQGWIIWQGAYNQSSNQLISIGVTGGKVEVAHWSNDTTFANSPITFGTFQNIVVTFDGSNEKIYVNSTNTDNKSTTLNIANGSWYIASRSNAAEYLNCNIASVQVYNKSLSAAEVLTNYNAMKGRFGLQ